MREGIVDSGKYGYLTTDENGDMSFEEVGRMPEYIEYAYDLETKDMAYTFKFTNQIGSLFLSAFSHSLPISHLT